MLPVRGSLWLGVWLFFSIAMTLSTKALLSIDGAAAPLALSALHMLVTFGGTAFLRYGLLMPYMWPEGNAPATGLIRRPGDAAAGARSPRGGPLSAARVRSQRLRLLAYTSLFCINILMGNVAVGLLTVSFLATVRSATPLVSVAVTALVLHKQYSQRLVASLVPLAVGVIMATYTEQSLSLAGLAVSFLLVLLSVVKGVATNVLLSGNFAIHPMFLLYKAAPVAGGMMLVAALMADGEMARFAALLGSGPATLGLVLANAVCAFGVNVASFSSNRDSGPVAVTVMGNVKQVLMIYISFHFFHSQISSWNAAGITITLVGAALYSVAKLADDNVERRRAKAAKNVARFKHDDDGILNDPSIPSVVLNTDEDMHRRLVSHV